MQNPYSTTEINARDTKWSNYQINSQGRSAQERLLAFLDKHKSEIHTATELGCGAGMDAAHLAGMGIKTYAFDGFMNDTIRQSLNQLPPNIKQNLTIGPNQLFENLTLPGPSDLVYSYAALPFCKPEYFPQLISTIVQNVNPNGYFVSQFFRNDHRFTKVENSDAIGFTVQQLTDVFEYLGFQVEAEEFKWEKTQNGDYSDDLHNIMIYAKAPEQLPEYTVEKIGELLGIENIATQTTDQTLTAPATSEDTTNTNDIPVSNNTFSSNDNVNNVVSEILKARQISDQPTETASANTSTVNTTIIDNISFEP